MEPAMSDQVMRQAPTPNATTAGTQRAHDESAASIKVQHAPASIRHPSRCTSSPTVSLDDFGQLPAAIVASSVAGSLEDFSALRLSCKAAFGSTIPSSSSNSTSVSHTGLTRQSTCLHLSSRVFADPPAPEAAATVTRPARSATEFLTRHSGVTTLSIRQSLGLENAHDVILDVVPDILPGLRALSIYVDCTDEDGEEVESYHMDVDVVFLGRLSSLTCLTLDHCKLGKGLSSALSKLRQLVQLDLVGSEGVGAVTLVGFQHLQWVGMRHSDVFWLTVARCPQLHFIEAEFSPAVNLINIRSCLSLTKLTVEHCSKLGSLHVRKNPALESVDASGCCMLTQLYAADCSGLRSLNVDGCDKLKNLELTGCCTLQTLRVGSLDLSEMDLSSCVALTRLHVSCSGLTSLLVCPTIQFLELLECPQLSALDLASHGQLQSLKLAGCSSLPLLAVTHLPRLQSLSVKGCSEMSALYVSSCPALETIQVCSAELAEFSITDLASLTCLQLSSTELPAEDEDDVTSLQLHINNCPALSRLTASHKGLAALDLSSMGSLRSLDASSCIFLTDLDIAGCTNLGHLVLSECSSLHSLYLPASTALHSLDLTGCYNLLPMNPQLLACSSLTSLRMTFNGPMPSLAELPNLTALHLYACNDITDVDLTSMSRLQRLEVKRCQRLTHMGGQGELTSVQEEVVSSSCSILPPKESASFLKQLSVSDCAALRLLDLAFYPALKELSVHNCDSLTAFRIRHCQGLTQLKVSFCEAITELDVHGASQLETLEQEGMYSLQHLNLDGCVSLHSLKLSESLVLDLDLTGCHALAKVFLDFCPSLTSLIAAGLPALVSLNVRGAKSLSAVNLLGSHQLQTVEVRSGSPGLLLDLRQAPNLAVNFTPAKPSALCPLCATSPATHGFLHLGSVHRACSGCVSGASPPLAVGEASTAELNCPFCNLLCQRAQFSGE